MPNIIRTLVSRILFAAVVVACASWPIPPAQVDGGQLFTYGNAVAYLPTEIALMFDWIGAVLAARLPAGSRCAAPCNQGCGWLARRPIERRDLDLCVLQLHSFERELVAL